MSSARSLERPPSGGESGWLTQMYEIQHDKLIHKHSGGESYVEARTANVKGSSEEQGEALCRSP